MRKVTPRSRNNKKSNIYWDKLVLLGWVRFFKWSPTIESLWSVGKQNIARLTMGRRSYTDSFFKKIAPRFLKQNNISYLSATVISDRISYLRRTNSEMTNTSNRDRYTSDWATNLGLLPVPLFTSDNMDRSVLLNGTSGNFCLDTTMDSESDDRAKAWSANVGHYIKIISDQVEVQRWSNTISERERYPLSVVARDLERFHNYLVSKEPPAQRAVVPHVVRVFRQIRNREELASGADALKVLLLLLACAATSNERSKIDTSKWAIPQHAENLSASISAN